MFLYLLLGIYGIFEKGEVEVVLGEDMLIGKKLLINKNLSEARRHACGSSLDCRG